ncbi:hypothetical protein [Actinoalloteichus caeruleus]|uniref:Uncharacterized protein n=1 Tax=Actinoalloteichus caeruleus DSM 43889 TaxID=1120930 RepID=A0ABT1JE04_ACTCY|nr:hypothetical protein [Actinoalloteichus caeruleus]MCP2330735.1 hypothetical protein [Actinoalloteichus caeruleus DSM 43889]
MTTDPTRLGLIEATTRHTVTAVLVTPALRRTSGLRPSEYEPRRLEVTYTREPGCDWHVVVSVTGPMVLHTGRPVRRIIGEYWGGARIETAPGWVQTFVERHHPEVVGRV